MEQLSNKLMVGDLIHSVDENGNKQIVRLTPLIVAKILTNSFEHEIQPIPITESFLEDNNFIEVKREDKYYHYYPGVSKVYRKDGYILLLTYRDCTHSYYMFDDDVRIRNVHELQHAFRLCGLDEIAESFIIKESQITQ